jgi:hypothetical protein
VTSATLTYAVEEELLEVVFNRRTTAMGMSDYSKAAARKGIFYVVHAEAI